MTKDEFFELWNSENHDRMIAISDKTGIDEDRNEFQLVMIGFEPNKVITGRIMLDFDEDDTEYEDPFDPAQLTCDAGSAAEDEMNADRKDGMPKMCTESIEKLIGLVTERNLDKYFERIARMSRNDEVAEWQVERIFGMDTQECRSRIEKAERRIYG